MLCVFVLMVVVSELPVSKGSVVTVSLSGNALRRSPSPRVFAIQSELEEKKKFSFIDRPSLRAADLRVKVLCVLRLPFAPSNWVLFLESFLPFCNRLECGILHKLKLLFFASCCGKRRKSKF